MVWGPHARQVTGSVVNVTSQGGIKDHGINPDVGKAGQISYPRAFLTCKFFFNPAQKPECPLFYGAAECSFDVKDTRYCAGGWWKDSLFAFSASFSTGGTHCPHVALVSDALPVSGAAGPPSLAE